MGDPSLCLHISEEVPAAVAEHAYEEENDTKTTQKERDISTLAADMATIPTVDLIYDGAIVRARIDSGAARSIVGHYLAKKINKRSATTVAVVQAVCGARVPIRYEARVSAAIFQKAY